MSQPTVQINVRGKEDVDNEKSPMESYEYSQTSSPNLSDSDHSDKESLENEHDQSQPRFADLEAATSNVLARVASRITTHSLPEPGPPPDGGARAWIQCAMAWLIVFNTWGYANSFGSVSEYYSTTLSQSPSTISWIGSVQVWILFFMGAFSGRALDAGYFVPALAVGMSFQVVGIFMTSLSTQYWQLFLAQGICTGIGAGIIFTPSMALLSTYFSKNKGLAVALVTTGNSAGGAIYPLIVRQLLPQIGFGWTIRVLGFINLACLGTALVFMKPRLPPRKSGPLIDLSAFKEVEYMLFAIGCSLNMASLYFSTLYIASYGKQILGLSYSDSIILLIILNGVGIPARVLAGFLADRYLGVLNTQIPILLYINVLCFCWLGVDSKTSLYVFVSFYGLGLASFQSLIPTSVARLTKDIRKTGTRMGMVFTFISFAALLGPPIGGALIEHDHGKYVYAQVWSGVTAAVGTALVIGARVYSYGWTLKVKC